MCACATLRIFIQNLNNNLTILNFNPPPLLITKFTEFLNWGLKINPIPYWCINCFKCIVAFFIQIILSFLSLIWHMVFSCLSVRIWIKIFHSLIPFFHSLLIFATIENMHSVAICHQHQLIIANLMLRKDIFVNNSHKRICKQKSWLIAIYQEV